MATPQELFDRLGEQIDLEKAKDLNATLQFDLSGENGGQWYVALENGACQVNQGVTPNPTATVKMDGQDYVDLVAGRLNPVNAFMTGKVKVEGDLNAVMKFQTLFNN